MSLIRLTKVLNINKTRFGANILPVYNYSSDNNKKSSDNSPKKTNKKKDDKTDDIKKEEIKEKAKDRLNTLLFKMGETSVLKIVKDIAPPKPGGYKKLRKVQKLDESVPPSTDIVDAIKDVAENAGDNKEQVEFELTNKVKSSGQSIDLNSILSSMKVSHEKPSDEYGGRRRSTHGGLSDQTMAESTMLERLNEKNKRYHDANAERYDDISFGRDRDSSRVRLHNRRQGDNRNAPITPTNLFGGAPLNIFTNVQQLSEGTQQSEDTQLLQTWKRLGKQELKVITTKAPRNYFEKMIMWTEQGYVWHFPIDNEQGLDEEAKVPFTDHVFLEDYLDPWCPRKGPLRHFMHLVCVGLSKNPYLTVEQKREHIQWYKDYFEEKKDVLSRMTIQQETPSINGIAEK